MVLTLEHVRDAQFTRTGLIWKSQKVKLGHRRLKESDSTEARVATYPITHRPASGQSIRRILEKHVTFSVDSAGKHCDKLEAWNGINAHALVDEHCK